ncbi:MULTISPECIES: LysR family transcriptional regulator [Paraburkholderia]|jgi:DNA-binding transcriptional LysR family regulator|uniref:LysR family transcriptional regulator n=1 Tax=Paraburkholderia caribensis TaxID=75105 RepID=A0A9Q6WL07_9BURK|nr:MULTISPECIES: LysR family transcriptional regulator [Paraburkholderia]ALP61666.1 LysR family transcriptional regulator [Paraburkholderia caribensis]AMV44047.1 LysR family transcriptional regulator [Paraburkholderia caribensis]AUT53107.1 LysR family transcriptional regulator [Paraburkholderia caribensis]MCO4882277.1 LysR substrate-binding domain-containing protein [Paraburkholderia caribensis]MDR6387115.1 DNA-binding transcriptional LysR family regulator [Paraburkholderia caribensis]
MELRALRYFVEVVRQQSFTVAAEQMFVTQPTISKMVKALEDETGSPLLLRDGRQMVLTDAGRIVYQRGQDVLAAYAQLQAELQDLDKLGRGELTIGIPPMGGSLFTPAIAAFRQRHPKIELKLFEQGSKAIEAALISGELELGGVLQPVDDMIDVLPMSRQVLWLVARQGSRWDELKEVPLADLASEPFVFYGESLALNDVVLTACRTAGFAPTIVGRSGHWDFMAALVLAGVGIALLPAPYCRRLDAAQFTCRPVVAPEIPWEMAIGWRRNGYLSHAARAWLEVARETLPGLTTDNFTHPLTFDAPAPAPDRAKPPPK